jgi:hypothetical protein
VQELVLLEKEKELLEREQTVMVLREEVSSHAGWPLRQAAPESGALVQHID